MKSLLSKHSMGIAVACVLSVVLLALLYWQAIVLNGLLVAVHSMLGLLLPIIALAATFTLLVRVSNPDFSGAGFGMWAALVLCTVWLVWQLATGDYRSGQALLTHVQVVQPKDGLAQMPEYESRAPFTVVHAQTRSHVTINGTEENTKYVPTDARYGTLVAKSGWLAGYGEVVFQKVDQTGQSSAQNCSFAAAANQKLGGVLGANLDRRIVHAAGLGTIIDREDAYGFCQDGHPKVVVPLKALDGWITPVQVPAGVAIYDGTTGELTIKRHVKPGELPGPVYPMSLARDARDATLASGSLMDYLQSRVGFQDTAGDDENADRNIVDFNLERKDRTGSDLVTPLTMRGRSSAVSAVAMLDATSLDAGRLNTTRIAMLPVARQANSAVQDRLRADYGSLPEWAAGMKIYEIVPTGPKTWSATLGQTQAINYRVELNADSSSCLFDANGTKLRCGRTTEAPKDIGKTDTTPLPNGDLSKMSDAQLAELNQKISTELAKRLAK